MIDKLKGTQYHYQIDEPSYILPMAFDLRGKCIPTRQCFRYLNETFTIASTTFFAIRQVAYHVSSIANGLISLFGFAI